MPPADLQGRDDRKDSGKMSEQAPEAYRPASRRSTREHVPQQPANGAEGPIIGPYEGKPLIFQ